MKYLEEFRDIDAVSNVCRAWYDAVKLTNPGVALRLSDNYDMHKLRACRPNVSCARGWKIKKIEIISHNASDRNDICKCPIKACDVIEVFARCDELQEVYFNSHLVKHDTLQLMRCDKLQTIRFWSCNQLTDDTIRSLSQRCPKLQCLDLSYGGINVTNSAFEFLFQCPKLKSVRLTHFSHLTDKTIDYLSRCGGLEDVDMSNCSNLTDRSLGFLSSCRELRSVIFAMSGNLTDDGVQLLTSCSKLYKVNFTGCGITDGAFYHLLIKCPELCDVDFTYCPQFTGASFKSLDPKVNFPNLRRVDFGHCSNLTDNVRFLVRQCPDLRSIEFVRCKKLTNLTVDSLLESCPKLEEISFSNCDQVTGVSFEYLSPALKLLELRTVSFAGCSLIDFAVCRLAEMAPNLQKLDVARNSNLTIIVISALAKACPKLKTLNIDGCAIRLSKGERLCNIFSRKFGTNIKLIPYRANMYGVVDDDSDSDSDCIDDDAVVEGVDDFDGGVDGVDVDDVRGNRIRDIDCDHRDAIDDDGYCFYHNEDHRTSADDCGQYSYHETDGFCHYCARYHYRVDVVDRSGEDSDDSVVDRSGEDSVVDSVVDAIDAAYAVDAVDAVDTAVDVDADADAVDVDRRIRDIDCEYREVINDNGYCRYHSEYHRICDNDVDVVGVDWRIRDIECDHREAIDDDGYCDQYSYHESDGFCHYHAHYHYRALDD